MSDIQAGPRFAPVFLIPFPTQDPKALNPEEWVQKTDQKMIQGSPGSGGGAPSIPRFRHSETVSST